MVDARFIFAGNYLNYRKVTQRYFQINDDNSLGEEYLFDKLFSRPKFGFIYDVKICDNNKFKFKSKQFGRQYIQINDKPIHTSIIFKDHFDNWKLTHESALIYNIFKKC